jgi:hypothetical protein
MRYPEIKTKLSALVVKTVEVAEVDNNDNPISEHQCESVAKPARGWGGPRPGSGAPKGNLNAFKHGRNSRRQAQLLEALLEIPEARQALIDLGKRNRRRRKQAEEGAGVLMTALLEKVAAIVLHSPVSQEGASEGSGATGEESGVRENNHGQNNQDFLDFLNLATAQIRTLLEKQPRIRGTSTKKLPPT